jgi:hypothetical protein
MEIYLSSLRREYSVDSIEIIDDTARIPRSSFSQETERAFLHFDTTWSSSRSLDSIDGSLARNMSQIALRVPHRRGRCRWSECDGNDGNFSINEIKRDRSPTPPIRR